MLLFLYIIRYMYSVLFHFRSVVQLYMDTYNTNTTDVYIYGENITEAICSDVNQFAVYMIEGSSTSGKHMMCAVRDVITHGAQCVYSCPGQFMTLGIFIKTEISVRISEIRQIY